MAKEKRERIKSKRIWGGLHLWNKMCSNLTICILFRVNKVVKSIIPVVYTWHGVRVHNLNTPRNFVWQLLTTSGMRQRTGNGFVAVTFVKIFIIMTKFSIAVMMSFLFICFTVILEFGNKDVIFVHIFTWSFFIGVLLSMM